MAEDAEQLLQQIRAVRADLPRGHRTLLDAIGVQEMIAARWPDDVLDLYRTLNEPEPRSGSLDGATAAWLSGLRAVVFNLDEIRMVSAGLNDTSRRKAISWVAWHEYGHALSVHRAKNEHHHRGPALLKLAPESVQQSIDFPGRYRTKQVFDELIATLYPMLIDRVRTAGYVQPDYLHDDVYAAFQEVIPWPEIP
jgi:hypothetical protein